MCDSVTKVNSLDSQAPLGTNPTPNRGRNRRQRTRRSALAVSRTVRPTWPDGPPAPDQNQQSLCTSSGLSRFERRIVRSSHADGPRFTQRTCYRPKTVRRIVRRSEPDGPLPLSGQSALSCLTPLHSLMNNPLMHLIPSLCIIVWLC